MSARASRGMDLKLRQTRPQSMPGPTSPPHQGAVQVPGHFTPGLIYNPTLDTWRQLAVSDLDELGQRKAAATALYANLDSQEYDLDKRMGVPTQVRGRVVDILAYARWACYSIFTGRHLHRRATDDLGNRDVDRAIRRREHGPARTEGQRLDRRGSADNDRRVGVSGRRRALCNGGREDSERQVERGHRRPDDIQPRQPSMDRGHYLMLPPWPSMP